MKNFKFKWLLLSIVLSIASINTMWAWDCGWWDEGTGEVTFSINGTEKSLGTVNRNKSNYADLDLGTVTSSLQIKSAWGKTWGQNNIYSMWLYYRVKVRDASSDAGFSEYQIDFDNNFGSNDSYWSKTINTSPEINNLAPGNYEIEYYMQIYLNNDHYAEYHYLNNGGNNYHANFTIPSKNLTVTTNDANGNTVEGSVTGVQKGHAYTIRANAKPGYRLNSWTATSGGSSITIADASSAETTVTFKDFSNDATVTASFVRTYAFIEGRFHVWNSSRSGDWTNSFSEGDWDHNSTNIMFDYDATNHLFYRHTYATPKELSTQISSYNPYFYIKTSTSTSNVTTNYVACYWSSSDQTLTSDGSKLSLIHNGSLDDDNLRFNNLSDNSGYVVLYFDESKIWYQLEQTLTYNGNGNTAGSAPATTYVERTKSVTAATQPGALAKSGYVFGGWNEANDGSGTNYTAGSSSVTMGSSNKTLYAKWTQTIKLHDNNGDAHSGSVTATYNATTVGTITAPTREGYTVEGYYAEAGCTNKVMEANGTLVNYTGYVVGGKWQHNAATTLYAKWTEDTHTVNVAAGSHGSVSPASVSGVGIATASGDITATADNGYDFSSWTLPDGVTAAGGYTNISNPIHINATADETITANFTAHPYNITLGAGDHGVADGSATVVFNTSALADGTTHVSANAGYQLDGYYDGELKVLNADGTFAGTNVSGYITDGKWSKYDADATLTAKFSPVTLYFRANSTSYWNTAANWTPNCVPTIYHDVVIEKPVEVNIAHAVAKSVVIDTMSSNTGKLTVQANKGLEVAETIKLKNNGGSLVATSSNNIVLESSADGNATLIFDNSTMHDSATVCLYSKGYTDGTQGGGTWVWQYVGVPVTNATRLSDYYGGYMYEWSGGTWVDKNTSEVLTPFNAYSVSYKTASNKLHTYVIDGELAATGDKTIAIPASTNIMFVANSWTAPIYIKKMVFTNARATVYLLNSGQGTITRTNSDARFAPNTYLPVPVQSSAYTGDSLIAPMQAFIVRNLSASAGTMNIDYGTVVRPARTDQNINAGEMHAPQRFEEEMSEPVVLKMYVDGTEYGDRVILLEREDFTRGFDNGWDGEKLQVNATTIAPRMFAINETGGKEAISAIPELNGTVIGFRPGTDATYTISFEYNGSEPLYLRDTRTNQMASIDNQSEYMFTSDGTNEDSRFIIVKSPAVVTDISETGVDAIARKQMIDGVLYIIRNGKIFSTDGQFVK